MNKRLVNMDQEQEVMTKDQMTTKQDENNMKDETNETVKMEGYGESQWVPTWFMRYY
jgi:hypothetical protein